MMRTPNRCLLAALAAVAVSLAVPGIGRAQFFPPSAASARTNFSYDAFGNLRGAYTVIQLNNGDVWWFALPAQFLSLPLWVQLNYIDAVYGLGWDRYQVANVLGAMENSLPPLALMGLPPVTVMLNQQPQPPTPWQQQLLNQQQQVQNMQQQTLAQQQQLQKMLNRQQQLLTREQRDLRKMLNQAQHLAAPLPQIQNKQPPPPAVPVVIAQPIPPHGNAQAAGRQTQNKINPPAPTAGLGFIQPLSLQQIQKKGHQPAPMLSQRRPQNSGNPHRQSLSQPPIQQARLAYPPQVRNLVHVGQPAHQQHQLLAHRQQQLLLNLARQQQLAQQRHMVYQHQLARQRYLVHQQLHLWHQQTQMHMWHQHMQMHMWHHHMRRVW